MATTVKDAQQRATAAAATAERERDKAQAVREYEAERLAREANIARLRALRLAKEAADAQEAKMQPPIKKKAASGTATARRAGARPRSSS
jgi:hypothetical protein